MTNFLAYSLNLIQKTETIFSQTNFFFLSIHFVMAILNCKKDVSCLSVMFPLRIFQRSKMHP